MDVAAAHLLDLSKELDISLLDQIMLIAMDGSHPQRSNANDFLVKMKDHPDMWKRADAILDKTHNEATRFFGLSVLGSAITTRWKVMPVEQREGIRNYIVGKIIGLSSTPEVMKKNASFLNRLNLVLVQILKQDWPQNWPTFISDIVGSSKTSESLCENNMVILRLLSEEVFDFSRDDMTSEKARRMKQSLNEEFAKVFQLCEFILATSENRSLICVTLKTLQRFISWIPTGYIFATSLLVNLLGKFFPVPEFRVDVIDCLTEVASLPENEIPPEFKPAIQQLLSNFMIKLQEVIPHESNLSQIYEDGSDDDQLFVSRLALFLGTFLRSNLKLFQNPPGGLMQASGLEPVLLESLHYLLLISEVDDEEIFKICLEFWHYFSKEQYTTELGLKTNSTSSLGSGLGGFFAMPAANAAPSPLSAYNSVHSRLRHVLIDRMAKPEEVIVIEDDSGGIIREMTKDTGRNRIE